MVEPRKTDEWYSISVETLRGWTIASLCIVVGVVGYLGWTRWQVYALERNAMRTVEEAQGLLQDLQGQQELSTFASEFEDGRGSYTEARDLLAEEQYAESLQSGRRSVALLTSILGALENRAGASEATIISSAGRVEFRRGESGEWEQARIRVSLRDGYYVRTSENGSAEIMFVDGTLYNVRPNTLFYISRNRGGEGEPGGQTIRMQYGWLDLSTAQRASRVATPESEAEVGSESAASVTYDEGSSRGRIAAYDGSVDVASTNGDVRRLRSLQEVDLRRGALSQPRPLPGAPEPQDPQNNFEVPLVLDETIILAWRPVANANRYALQVSADPLFVENMIDVANRRRVRATLGIKGEGNFVWRVAAINGEGRQGPWSPVRKFRVAANVDLGEREIDNQPPELVLNSAQAYGSIFIITGITEPGVTLTVSGEPVTVAANGTFTKTIQLYDNGYNVVEVRARDSYGNETRKRIRLFVEATL
ncbi:MAG: hypothetical protein AAGD01_01920 [Acidobacteriota bacterium]